MELKNFFALDDQGNALAGATCYVYLRGTESLTNGLQAANGRPLTNPFVADQQGLIQFAVPNGLYDVRVKKESRDYRIRAQFNDVTETVATAEAAASRAEVARDAAVLSSGVKDDVAHGLATTPNGENFPALSSEPDKYVTVYKNNAGVAVPLASYPSTEALEGLQRRDVLSQRVPLTFDEAGNVPLWLHAGALEVAGIGPEMALKIEDISGTKPVDSSNRFVPVLFDEVGNVALWLEDGYLSALGLSKALIATLGLEIAYAPANKPASSVLPTATDGRTLHAWRSRLAKVKRAGQGQAKLLITGDSWTEYVAIPQQLSSLLHAQFGKAGEGWISVNGTYMLNGVTLAKSGWSLFDASTGAVPVYGTGVDGMYVTTAGVAATLTVGNLTCTNFDIYYRQHGGTFRWRVDGGAWTSVVADNTGALGKVSIAGLSTATHAIEIDTAANAGTVVLCGFRASTPAAVGVEILKAGNAGLDGEQLARFTSFIGPIAQDFAPDVVVVALSTNDYRRASSTVEKYIAALELLVSQYRGIAPDCAFIFIAPADSNGVAVRPLTSYRDALYAFCISHGHEFYNMYDEWGSFNRMNALGMWVDDLHLNDNGAYALASRLSSKFLI